MVPPLVGSSRVAAKGTALQALVRELRFTALLTAAEISPTEIDAARATDQWRPLLTHLAEAERLALDPNRAIGGHEPDQIAGRLSDLYVQLDQWIDRTHQPRRTMAYAPDRTDAHPACRVANRGL